MIENSSVQLLDFLGNDLAVVNAARVSFNKTQDVFRESDKKLIEYLAKHKHKSPFNHAFLKFRVKAPVFIARQMVKHEYLVWNEVSRRYVTDEPTFYLPEVWRKKADNVKQGSSDEEVELQLRNFNDDRDGKLDETPFEIYHTCLSHYNQLLEAGVCAEQARMVLPQSMMTEWIWSGSLYSFVKMVALRTDPHAQKECRDVAEEIGRCIKTIFPVSYNALMEHGGFV